MLSVSKVDVWSATIEDKPGGLDQKLDGLAKAGADLEFMVSRRLHESPGKGIVFLTPLTGEKQMAAARQFGFKLAEGMHSLRVEGPDQPGAGHRVVSALAGMGINLRGVSAFRQRGEFVIYLAFDTQADADKAAAKLRSAV